MLGRLLEMLNVSAQLLFGARDCSAGAGTANFPSETTDAIPTFGDCILDFDDHVWKMKNIISTTLPTLPIRLKSGKLVLSYWGLQRVSAVLKNEVEDLSCYCSLPVII
jgi:hypothetical protein